MHVPEDADRDFVAGTLLVENGEILLVDHGKYDFWLPPGGHIERRETPDETALRETKEETGVEAELVDSFEPVREKVNQQFPLEPLPRPFDVNIHEVREGHWHCDLLYLARARAEGEASHGHEHSGTRWFSREELESGDYDVPKHLQKIAIKALEEVE